MYPFLTIILIGVGIVLVLVFFVVLLRPSNLNKETVVLDDVARKWEGNIDQNEHGPFFNFNYGGAKVTVSNLWTRFEKPLRYSKVHIEAVFENIQPITIIAYDQFIPLERLSCGDPQVTIDDVYFRKMFFTQSQDPDFTHKLLGSRLRRSLMHCVWQRPVVKILADSVEVSFYKQPSTEKEYDTLIDLALVIHDSLMELKRSQEKKFL